jgi:heavy metal sensor kinase
MALLHIPGTQWAENLTIRTRLTVWYSFLLAIVLTLFIGVTCAVLFWQLHTQLTRFAIQDVETVEGLLSFASDGNLQLNESYHNHVESRQVLERLLEVVAPDGTVLLRNSRLRQDRLGAGPFTGEGVGGYSPRAMRLGDGSRVLVVSRQHSLDGRQIIIRVGHREDAIFTRLREFVTAAFTALPILIAIASLLSYHLARKALAPLQEMATRAEHISAEHLDKRLPIANARDEIGLLGTVVNDLLNRLDQSFNQLRRFTADASHELRTPLAAIRSVGEVSLQGENTAEAYRDAVGSMLEEVGRLTALVENLLSISRGDAGQIALEHSTFAATELVSDAVNLIQVLAEERGQQITLAHGPDLLIWGDRLLARQALLNVLHNATKYSPPGGQIAVEVRSADENWVEISVLDSGPGISPEHREKVFDRFYRIDEARTRDAGGSGLGLAIAKWSIEVQGGIIRVVQTKSGTPFVIRLPKSDHSRSHSGTVPTLF